MPEFEVRAPMFDRAGGAQAALVPLSPGEDCKAV